MRVTCARLFPTPSFAIIPLARDFSETGSHFSGSRAIPPPMPNLLILTEVQEAMRARYKAMLLERFPQLTINVVGHHNAVEPLHRRHRHPAVLFAAHGRPCGARRAEAEMDPGARHRRRQHRRPALARQRGAGHQYPRHPWRAGVGSHHRLYALARARPAALGPCAGQQRLGALAVAAARRQDRRHSRRRADRGISGADLQAVRHDGDRHQRQPARRPKASTAWSRATIS